LLSAPHASRAAFIDGEAIACSKKPSDVWFARASFYYRGSEPKEKALPLHAKAMPVPA
jgi:hypothetical protein